MSRGDGETLGRVCALAGGALLCLAVLSWLVTALTALPLGIVTVLAVPPGVVLLLVGVATLGYGTVAKVAFGLLGLAALVGATFLIPVLRALNLLRYAVVFCVLLVVLAAMARMNSQELRRTGSLSIDDSKGYDGQSDDREWIPPEQDGDEPERENT